MTDVNDCGSETASLGHEPDWTAPARAGAWRSFLVFAGFVGLLAFLLLAYGRLSEVYLANLSLPLAASVLAFTAVLLSGGLRLSLRSGTTWWLLGFTLWLVAAIPSSLWPGGSVALLKDVWLKSLLLFVTIAGLPLTIGRCRRAMSTIALGGIVVCALVIALGVYGPDGRVSIPVEGVLGNPNELAMILVIGLPFVWFVTPRRAGRAWWHIVSVVVALLFLRTILATGSRSALLALVAVGVVAFHLASGRMRLLMVVAILLGILATIITMPAQLKARYVTMFGTAHSSEIADDQLAAAVGSKEQRTFLLLQSIQLTARHPVFGVGPGMYQVASAGEKDEGREGFWKESHNSYTQVSSEAGLPALFAYLVAFGLSVRAPVRVFRQSAAAEHAEFRVAARLLLLSFAGYAVVSFFDSVAYHLYFPTLAGLAVALQHAWTAEAAKQAA